MGPLNVPCSHFRWVIKAPFPLFRLKISVQNGGHMIWRLQYVISLRYDVIIWGASEQPGGCNIDPSLLKYPQKRMKAVIVLCCEVLNNNCYIWQLLRWISAQTLNKYPYLSPTVQQIWEIYYY